MQNQHGLVQWHSLSWCGRVENMLWWHGLQRRNLFCAGSSVKLDQFVYTLEALNTGGGKVGEM